MNCCGTLLTALVICLAAHRVSGAAVETICPPGCEEAMIGDGNCDAECNSLDCGDYDGGDCVSDCDGSNPPGVDLIIQYAKLWTSIFLEKKTFESADCEVDHGCVLGTGQRRLLRFGALVANVGCADFDIGTPPENPSSGSPGGFEWDPCHDHWHYQGWGEYALLDTAGDTVLVAMKSSWCILDPHSFGPDVGQVCGTHGCKNDKVQGLSAGCADLYGAGLDCQYIDVTDIPNGDYILRVAVNHQQIFNESTYDNNILEVKVVIREDWAAPVLAFNSTQETTEVGAVEDGGEDEKPEIFGLPFETGLTVFFVLGFVCLLVLAVLVFETGARNSCPESRIFKCIDPPAQYYADEEDLEADAKGGPADESEEAGDFPPSTTTNILAAPDSKLGHVFTDEPPSRKASKKNKDKSKKNKKNKKKKSKRVVDSGGSGSDDVSDSPLPASKSKSKAKSKSQSKASKKGVSESESGGSGGSDATLSASTGSGGSGGSSSFELSSS